MEHITPKLVEGKAKVKWMWKSLSPVDSLRSQGLYSSLNSPGQNTGVGSLSLLQGIFQPRAWTQVSCIAGGILYQLGYWESQQIMYIYQFPGGKWICQPLSGTEGPFMRIWWLLWEKGTTLNVTCMNLWKVLFDAALGKEGTATITLPFSCIQLI